MNDKLLLVIDHFYRDLSASSTSGINGVCFSLSGAAVAGVYRVAGKDMAPLEALVFGVGQTTLSVIISFSRILATL